MKSVCPDCKIVFLTNKAFPLHLLTCAVCHGRLKSYEEEKKRREVWIESNFIITDLARLVRYRKHYAG